MKINLEAKGFRELERALAEELPKATAKNVLRRAAINVMQDRIESRAKQYVPVERGDLRDSIATKNVRAKRQRGSVRYARSEGIEVATGPTGPREEGSGNPAWQEFGTVKMQPNPYMRPAADVGGQQVIDDVREELTLQIDKAKARIAKKAAKGK